MNENCCVVIGGYINGYSIIQELYENNVKNIILIDFNKDISYFSNKVTKKYIIENSYLDLKNTLTQINYEYHSLILFPTQDIHLKYISIIYNEVSNFCKVPFNNDNINSLLNKNLQYQICESIGIPYPKTIFIETIQDISQIDNLKFPIIIKPTEKNNLSDDVFRNATFENALDFNNFKNYLSNLLNNDYQFIVSEIIPGSDSNIYAYIGLRDSDGTIWGEWTGRKLSQFPNQFGVFSTATGLHNDTILDYGRKLITEMNLWGVNEPEFKFDERDNQFKLMEVNLRPMMWHRVGALNGMPLNYLYYLLSTNQNLQNFKVEKYKDVNYINIHYELINLITRKKYFKIFISNIFMKKIVFAGFDINDIKPFFYINVMIFKKFFHKKQRDKIQ